MRMFTDGCAKQCKGRRNFRLIYDSLRRVGFVVEHHFASPSDFKGCHDSIGGEAKNAMNLSEARGNLIDGAADVVCFLEEFFDNFGKKDITDYFATWSPYRTRRVHVKQTLTEGGTHAAAGTEEHPRHTEHVIFRRGQDG